jgi:DNA polymerase-1
MKPSFFIIDSHAYLYKNYFALPKLTTSKGEEVGALYGFIRLVLKILNEKNPDYIVACYDSRTKTKREEMYSLYKANRPKTDEELIRQINLSYEIVDSLGIKTLSMDGYEADDIIATIVGRFEGKTQPIIVSQDKDIHYLISKGALIWDGSSEKLRDENFVLDKFGISSDKIFDYLCLIGDSSDNIPGVAGIGPKKAVNLISKYGNIDNIIENALSNEMDKDLKKVKDSIENLKISKELVKLNDKLDIPFSLEEFKRGTYNYKNISELAQRFEFKELLKISSTNSIELFSDVQMKYREAELSEFKKEKLEYVSIYKNVIASENIYSKYGNAKEIEDILKNNEIKKYFYDYKEFLIENEGFKSVNYEDLHIAYYLLYGASRKPDIKRIIMEYENKEIDESLYPIFFKDIFEKTLAKLKEIELYDLYLKEELPLIEIIYEMEKNGFLLDKNELFKISSYFENLINSLKDEFFKLTGYEINLNSPKQVSDFIYGKLNIEIPPDKKKLFKTKTGYSTSEEALLFFEPFNPAISVIIKHRELTKLKNSFIDVLLEKISQDDRIRTSFDQIGTATGRLSSSNPNLQNIPIKSDYGQKIRSCFISPKGKSLLSFDYSQIDLRVLAHLSKDKNLVEAFKNSVDIHNRTASQIFKIDEKQISADQRRIAKTINFGIIYGQTPMGLSREISIPYEDAKKYIDEYFNLYKDVKKWIDETIEFAKKNGYVKNFVNRIRIVSDINSPNRNLRSFSERMAVNMPVQSGSSDIIKKAMVNIWNKIALKEDIKIISQIHDELIFEAQKESIDYWAKSIKEEMENCFKLEVPLVVAVKAGEKWSEMKKIL